MRSIGGKKVAVLGFGRTGIAAAKFLSGKGAHVTVYDDKRGKELAARLRNLEEGTAEHFFFGKNCEEALRGADMAVVSPGVPDTALPMKIAGENKIRVISELELFYPYCKSEIVAVTGTNGKTTTTVLISNLLNRIGYDTIASGNTGLPLTGLEPRYYDGASPVVCEISSFQLEHTFRFRPYVSVILNVTADHLDRYPGFREYSEVKGRLVANQEAENFAVLNADDETVRKFSERTRARVIWLSRRRNLKPGVRVCKNKIIGTLDGKTIRFPVSDIGLNNIYNCLAVAAIGLIYGAGEDQIRDTFRSFSGLEHRREFVTEINSVRFINDSKATNSDALLDGLETVKPPIVLICGGRDKGLDFAPLRDIVEKKVGRMIIVGEARKKLKNCFKDIVPCIESEGFHEAVRAAYEQASPGGTVLLSPGCASFDMFSDFEERGTVFKAEVFNLKKEREPSKRFL